MPKKMVLKRFYIAKFVGGPFDGRSQRMLIKAGSKPKQLINKQLWNKEGGRFVALDQIYLPPLEFKTVTAGQEVPYVFQKGLELPIVRGIYLDLPATPSLPNGDWTTWAIQVRKKHKQAIITRLSSTNPL